MSSTTTTTTTTMMDETKLSSMSSIQPKLVQQVYKWEEAKASLERGVPCFFYQDSLGIGEGWFRDDGLWFDMEKILKDTGRRIDINRQQKLFENRRKSLMESLSQEEANRLEEFNSNIPTETKWDTTDDAITIITEDEDDNETTGNTSSQVSEQPGRSPREASHAKREIPTPNESKGKKTEKKTGSEKQKRQKQEVKEDEDDPPDGLDPPIIVSPNCSAIEEDERLMYLEDFFTVDDSRDTDECWNFNQDDRARVHLRASDMYPLDSGDLLSFWEDQCDRTSSHQFIVAAAAPKASTQTSLMVCPSDGATIERRFPCGATAFVRLFPGQGDARLTVTIIHSSDVDMLCRDCGVGSSIPWTSLPLAPFVRNWEISLEQNQVIALPEGCACAIRSSDPTKRVFYYTRFAVFPDLGGANFILGIFDSTSSFSQQVVLWNAAHRFSDWLEFTVKTKRPRHLVQRLIDSCIKIRQCVAHLSNTVVPPDPDWDWKQLVLDLDAGIALAKQYCS